MKITLHYVCGVRRAIYLRKMDKVASNGGTRVLYPGGGEALYVGSLRRRQMSLV